MVVKKEEISWISCKSGSESAGELGDSPIPIPMLYFFDLSIQKLYRETIQSTQKQMFVYLSIKCQKNVLEWITLLQTG